MNRKSKKPGYTLTELMIIISVIGIISAIMVPKFEEMIIRAKESAVYGKLGAVRSAINIYYADNEGKIPKELKATLTAGGKYFMKWPSIQIPRNSHGNPGHPDSAYVYKSNYPLFGFCQPGGLVAPPLGFWDYDECEGVVRIFCFHKTSNDIVWYDFE